MFCIRIRAEAHRCELECSQCSSTPSPAKLSQVSYTLLSGVWKPQSSVAGATAVVCSQSFRALRVGEAASAFNCDLKRLVLHSTERSVDWLSDCCCEIYDGAPRSVHPQRVGASVGAFLQLRGSCGPALRGSWRATPQVSASNGLLVWAFCCCSAPPTSSHSAYTVISNTVITAAQSSLASSSSINRYQSCSMHQHAAQCTTSCIILSPSAGLHFTYIMV